MSNRKGWIAVMIWYSTVTKDCKIIYDFWGETGDMSFFFMNNTDKDIYIDLSRSFFIPFNSIIKIDKYKSAKKFYNKYQAPGNAPMLY